MNNIVEFLNLFFAPIFSLANALLSYPVFGFPLYSYLLTLFIFSFVIGFITTGSVTVNGVSNIVSGSINAGRAASIERKRDERRSYVGFRYNGE